MRELARAEVEAVEPQVDEVVASLQEFLRPRDPNDQRDVILEIRGAEGGQEANLWAAELMRMYMKYAELKSWKVEVLNTSETDLGGIKEVIFEIHGRGGLLAPEVGGRRASRPAGARDRDAGPHPHLGRDGQRVAESRRS